jgi:ribose/xylose/arabinose/galactoside ABC-type transport system permease subunit
MADRILVFRGGRVVAEVPRDSFNREAIQLAAAHAVRGAERIAPTSDELSDTQKRRPAERATASGALEKLLRIRELCLILALLVICAGVTAREYRFLQPSNLQQVALSAILVGIVALGEALVIIARQIDLSIGAMVAMSAFISADWLESHPQSSIFLILLLGCAIGLGLGLFNALLVAILRIPAIVATLGTLAIYRGGVIVLAGGRQISATSLPDNYGDIARMHLAGMPLLVWLAAVLTIALGLAARFTQTGRNLYALGSNPEGARLAGISEAKHVAVVFTLSGLLSGLVGVLWGSRFGTVDAVLAPDLQLQAISAVVVGGVSIFGGSGSVYGAAIGAVIFAVLQNGVQLLGINQFWLQAVIGAAILGTVLFYSRLAQRAERIERESLRGRVGKRRASS